VKKHDNCKKYGNVNLAPSSWPFSLWILDIIISFSMAPKQLKYLVVAMDIIYQVGRSKNTRATFVFSKKPSKQDRDL
jgi:hypothetical protein